MEAIKLQSLAKLYEQAHGRKKAALQKININDMQSATDLLAAKMQLFLMQTIIENYVLDINNINAANPYEICPLCRLARDYQNVAVKEQALHRSEYTKEYSDGGRIYSKVNLRKAASQPKLIYCKNGELVTISNDKARKTAETAQANFYNYMVQNEQVLLE